MTKLHELADLGQSIWLDYMRRSFVTSGDLADLVHRGLRGVTSNPSIFEQAIAGSTDYDEDLHRLVDAGRPVKAIYEHLALDDIQRAADVLRPVYDLTQGLDGYVSLEVSPTLAYDTDGTIAEARRLFAALDRPNVMIKVPGTTEGIPAIETLIAEGINVNVTLLFSLDRYETVAQAYLRGLERRRQSGGDLEKLASVASFFISRVDVQVDPLLEARGAEDLIGQIGIANSKLAYERFCEIFSGETWEALATLGARPQRVLWASTSTKNPAFPDTMYVDNLIGPETVNTLPPATLQAFLDHGRISPSLVADLAAAQAQIKRLPDLGINLDAITERLLSEGVEAFIRSFEALLESITRKRERLLSGWEHLGARLGELQGSVETARQDLEAKGVMARIWAHDHTLWSPDPTEITNRLGWLHAPSVMKENLPRLEALAAELATDGIQDALLVGMGGSSLAPEMFRNIFGDPQSALPGRLRLSVLDSTDPDAVRRYLHELDPARTVYLVATKSGGTVETLSFFRTFYRQVVHSLGEEQAGSRFIAITDPGSKLVDLAERYHFRAVFLNDPNIGGRYSALSYFGILPAVLVGADAARLLDRALAMLVGCEACVPTSENPGIHLGAILGELANAGRDKLTLVVSPAVASFGDWVEQLIAESTGKRGRGILPVVGEPPGAAETYSQDRLFVHLRLETDSSQDSHLKALQVAGHPVVTLRIHDPYDLGGQIALWEVATAVAGERLGINPFDQPNVESAKVRARELVQAYQEQGDLPEEDPSASFARIRVYGEVNGEDLAETLTRFLGEPWTGAPMEASGRPYIAIQAFIDPTEEAAEKLVSLRRLLRDRYHLATTAGFGPRFLHSTGQLHKGDSGGGLFIQITSDPREDLPIPDSPRRDASSISFGVLKLAQAMGDRQALEGSGRRVIRYHIEGDLLAGLDRLLEAAA